MCYISYIREGEREMEKERERGFTYDSGDGGADEGGFGRLKGSELSYQLGCLLQSVLIPIYISHITYIYIYMYVTSHIRYKQGYNIFRKTQVLLMIIRVIIYT